MKNEVFGLGLVKNVRDLLHALTLRLIDLMMTDRVLAAGSGLRTLPYSNELRWLGHGLEQSLQQLRRHDVNNDSNA